MSRIPLREYLDEIENLIENDRNDEAIAHCRQITQVYPRHLAAKRLLGKAQLAINQYQEAATAFQEVLDAAPDDPVAHLGLSVIRENQGDLDASIRHMERAFDVQPANATIQGELRRLYKERDGLEPQKIHLSRGALARMYAKGDLYSQAIAELRAALGEDPQRPDLQLVLAKMYAKSGQLLEAADACSTLLGKVPDCLEAHLILGDILSRTERSADAQNHFQRAAELDPYAAHLAPGQQDPSLVPAESIMFDRQIDFPAGTTEAEPTAIQEGPEPAEARQIFDSQQYEQIEEVEMDEETSETGDLPVEPPVGDEPPKDVIPDWMQSAGWEPATGAGEEPEPEFEGEPAESPEEEELVKAEIPEWLKPLAPSEAEETSFLEAEEMEEIEKVVSWSDESDEGEPGSPEQPLELGSGEEPRDGYSAAEGMQPEPESPTPDWMEAEAEQSEAELPDWLKSEEEPEAGLPDWLKASEETEAESESGAEQPDWMLSIEEEQPEPEESLPGWLKSEVEEQPGPDEQVPDWLEALESESPAQEDVTGEGARLYPAMAETDAESVGAGPDAETGMTGVPEAALPDWMQSADDELPGEPAAMAGVSSWEAAGESEEPEDETAVPEWMKPMDDESPGEEHELPEEQYESAFLGGMEEPAEAELPSAPSEVPDWLRAALEEQEGSQAEQPEDVPDWLRPSTSESFPEEPPPILGDTKPVRPREFEGELEEAAFEPEAIVDEPVDLETDALAASGDESTEALVEMPADAGELDLLEEETYPPEAESETGAEMEGAAAMGWLESLAAREGAQEEELLTRPEDRSESIPEWLEKMSVETEAEEEVSPEGSPEAEEEELETEGSSWEPEAEGAAFLEVEEEAVGAGELEMEQASLQPEMEAQEEGAGEQEASTAELEQEQPAWESAPEAEQEVQGEPAAELPHWLRDFAEEGTGAAMTEEVAEEEIAGLALEPLDLNTATLAQLERVPEIGYIQAQNIIAYREAHGPLKSRADLENVPGISQEAVDRFEAWGAFEQPVESFPQVEEAREAMPEFEPGEQPSALSQAWGRLVEGEVSTAVDLYGELIRKEQHLDQVIHELREAAFLYPQELSIHQALGDAYLRANRLQEALDAYNKAEELLE